MDKLLEAKMPEGWVIVQSLATVDSTTYDLYMNNMRAMMQEQVFSSDVVIFNRTDDDTDRGHLRRTIKNINRKAQIVYERKDGTIDERPEELPFDINQDVIELTDADYAIWYMDAMENYKKYDRKKVKFLALVYNPDKLKKGVFVPGRFAMTCCIEDVTFIGFKCKYDREEELPHKSWITITAEIRVEFAREYKGKGPVLYPISIEKASQRRFGPVKTERSVLLCRIRILYPTLGIFSTTIGTRRFLEHEQSDHRHRRRLRQRQDHTGLSAQGAFRGGRGAPHLPRQLLQTPRRAAL